LKGFGGRVASAWRDLVRFRNSSACLRITQEKKPGGKPELTLRSDVYSIAPSYTQ
jgi:hypothetical protein